MTAPAAGLLDELTTLVSQAAAGIVAVRAGPLAPRIKSDHSPVTAADQISEAILLDGLSRLFPDVPVVSEEAVPQAPAVSAKGTFILVDPLDGTRELLDGRDEFTINVAVISDGHPSLGIVAAPALATLWRAAEGGPAERFRLAPGAPASAARERTTIRPRAIPPHGLIAAVSRLHLDPQTERFLARLSPAARMPLGSALKFCRVAEGAADIYPRLAPTREWDIAAGHALLAAAGGLVTSPEGEPLRYGHDRQGFLVPAFIAWGSPEAAARLRPGMLG